jgi:urease accessory protein
MENRMTARLRRAALVSVPLAIATAPAFAHHMMGGRTPETFMEGLLSGLAHPVIGLDHFAFLAAIGIAVGAFGLNLLLPAAFVVAMAAGVAVHVSGITLPGSEIVVAASLVAAGLILARGRPMPVIAWGALFALAGLFHGYALGESIYGAERAPLVAYLVGLAAVQSVLAIGIALATRRLDTDLAVSAPRVAGLIILGVGAVAMVGSL